ncbi:MAG: N-acetylglucosamine-6-phosphate deacetylase [Eubacterium sp.]
MVINNGLIFTERFQFERNNIRIENGIITEITEEKIEPENLEEVVDAENLMVIPGLTDLHFHGCVGYDFCDGTDEAITKMAEFQRSKGITNICPATMTLPKERLENICRVAAEHKSEADEADLCGINLEGPFISPKRCGAQNPDYVHKPDKDFLIDLMNRAGGLTKLVTIAPEEEGAIECIEALKDKIKFSVGHTVADYDEADKAFQAGAGQATHLFNAMPPFTHREPGVIGAAVDHAEVMVELICDGIHIHPSAIRTAFKMFGEDRVILISDSMRACGMPDGEYELGGLPVIKKGSTATLKDGTLAGSVTNLFDCMINAIKMGIPVEQAVRAATYNPAKSIGILDQCGSIEKGKEGKLVLLDQNYNIVRVIK